MSNQLSNQPPHSPSFDDLSFAPATPADLAAFSAQSSGESKAQPSSQPSLFSQISQISAVPAAIATAARSPKTTPNKGLAPLLLTVVELVRQLMEAQIIRRMEAELLSDQELDRAAESLRKLADQVVATCKTFDIDPASLNLDLGEMGSLLPKSSSGYYPGEKSEHPTLLELVDRLLHTGVVIQGEVDLGLAQIDLIHARLQLVLTSQPL